MKIGDEVETNLGYQLKQLGKWGTIYYTGTVTKIHGNIVTVDNKKKFLSSELNLI